MVLEVNNTFDERRMYFLKASATPNVNDASTIHDNGDSKSGISDGANSSGNHKNMLRNYGKFKRSWVKDFHVSPFNSREGSYELTAHDPLSPYMSDKGPINNTITLISSKSQIKLVARVFSTEGSVDPATLTPLSSLRFVMSWWWVGFVTFPRIVNQAGKLFFRHKLHVWYRPEVLKDSIGRRETEDEKYVLYISCKLRYFFLITHRVVEEAFRDFLDYQVQHSTLGISVKYIAPITDRNREEIFRSKRPESRTAKRVDAEMVGAEELEFRVLTPAFYARFVQYAHVSEFIDQELLVVEARDRTFWVSNPKILSQLFDDGESADRTSTIPATRSWLDRLRWSVLRRLRISHYRLGTGSPVLAETPGGRYTDIRIFPLSSMDYFIINHSSAIRAQQYRRVVTKLLLSNHIVFGIPALIDLYGTTLRLLLCYFTVKSKNRMHPANCPFVASSSMLRVTGAACLYNCIHIWRLIQSIG